MSFLILIVVIKDSNRYPYTLGYSREGHQTTYKLHYLSTNIKLRNVRKKLQIPEVQSSLTHSNSLKELFDYFNHYLLLKS